MDAPLIKQESYYFQSQSRNIFTSFDQAMVSSQKKFKEIFLCGISILKVQMEPHDYIISEKIFCKKKSK